MLSTWAAALFPSERFGFGLGAISSELGFFLCDFFGTPPAALACFAGCFALALAMLTRYPDAALLVVASARAPRLQVRTKGGYSPNTLATSARRALLMRNASSVALFGAVGRDENVARQHGWHEPTDAVL